VYFNRNGTTIDKNDATYRAIAALGPQVVAYDYRGYGFSLGIPGVHLMQEDAVRIVDAVAKDAGARGVVLYGHSIGTAVAAYAASQTAVAGVILAAPVASAQEELPIALAGSGVPANVAATITLAPDAIAAFAVADFVGRFQAPLLVLHGTADTEVPIAQGREVYAASTSPRKRFVEGPGLNHDQIVNAPDSRAAVKAFVATLTR
jgi:pimeloyl-ACP methyl ester carboxylesterase